MSYGMNFDDENRKGSDFAPATKKVEVIYSDSNNGSNRISRGGGWNDDVWFVRASYRFRSVPGYRSGFLGFRSIHKGEINMREMKKIPHTTPFYMDATSVTVAFWRTFCDKNEDRPYKLSMPELPSGYSENAPIINVSWFDALEFCNRRSIAEGLAPYYEFEMSEDGETVKTISVDPKNMKAYRLPTEQQYEFACRGGVDAEQYGPIDEIAWHYGNVPEPKMAQPVGLKKPNAYGLYDVLGNVWSWTESKW